MLSHQAFALE